MKVSDNYLIPDCANGSHPLQEFLDELFSGALPSGGLARASSGIVIEQVNPSLALAVGGAWGCVREYSAQHNQLHSVLRLINGDSNNTDASKKVQDYSAMRTASVRVSWQHLHHAIYKIADSQAVFTFFNSDDTPVMTAHVAASAIGNELPNLKLIGVDDGQKIALNSGCNRVLSEDQQAFLQNMLQGNYARFSAASVSPAEIISPCLDFYEIKMEKGPVSVEHVLRAGSVPSKWEDVSGSARFKQGSLVTESLRGPCVRVNWGRVREIKVSNAIAGCHIAAEILFDGSPQQLNIKLTEPQVASRLAALEGLAHKAMHR